MAEFTTEPAATSKRRGKGKVGISSITPIKAEVMDGNGMKLSVLGDTIPDTIEEITEGIKFAHKDALSKTGAAILAAARAGRLLAAAKTKIPKEKNYTEWLSENFEFSQRTAYVYMKVAEAMVRRAPEIEKCESIRDVLKLCDSENIKKKAKDPKHESFITWAAKIEKWYSDEIAAMPLEDWPRERRELCKHMLVGVNRIFEAL